LTWEAELVGDAADLESLRLIFPKGDAMVCRDPTGRYFITSSAFDHCVAAVEVAPLAEDLIVMMNGIARVTNLSYRPVSIGAHFRDAPDRTHVVIAGKTVEVRTLMPGPAEPAASPPGQVWIALAAADPNVREALELLGAGTLTWDRLYKVFEIIKDDVGGDITKVGLATSADVTAFTAGANRPDVSGSDARHARMPGATPRRAMSPEEGRQFTQAVVTAWVASKEAKSAYHEELDDE